MLCVEVSLSTVGTGEFSIRVLLRDYRILRGTASCRGSGSTRSAGQNTATSLRSDYVSRLFIVLEKRLLVRHHGAPAIGRRQTSLRHDSAGRHGTKDRGSRCSRGGRDRLRVRGRDRSLRHHGCSCRIGLLRLLILIRHHAVRTTSRTRVRWRVLAHVRRLRCVWSTWRSRCVRMATVDRLHSRGVVLQRRQCVLD